MVAVPAATVGLRECSCPARPAAGRFIPDYYRDLGVNLPVGPLLEQALTQEGRFCYWTDWTRSGNWLSDCWW